MQKEIERLKMALLTALKDKAELLDTLKEVVRISDRKHDAWDKAHRLIAKAEGK